MNCKLCDNMSWWKKKQKEGLELKEEEREASLTTPFGSFRRKRVYAPKSKVTTAEPQKATEKPKEAAKKPLIIEDIATIPPNQYEYIDLGDLQRGTIISLECSAPEGGNFSFYIVDEGNLKRYKKEGVAPKPLAKGSGEDEYKEKVTVAIARRYYMILTTRAMEYNRKVWYRVELE